MEIFNKLWVPKSKNKNLSHPYDSDDFRNDVAITRNEVIKLIEGLGGKYDDGQGKGSQKANTTNDQIRMCKTEITNQRSHQQQ